MKTVNTHFAISKLNKVDYYLVFYFFIFMLIYGFDVEIWLTLAFAYCLLKCFCLSCLKFALDLWLGSPFTFSIYLFLVTVLPMSQYNCSLGSFFTFFVADNEDDIWLGLGL